MTRRLIESLSGIGAIHAGGLLLRTTDYHLRILADDTAHATSGESEANATIEGNIDITGIAEAVVLAGPGTLTLTIEDGRRLAFQITSSGGDILAQGWV